MSSSKVQPNKSGGHHPHLRAPSYTGSGTQNNIIRSASASMKPIRFVQKAPMQLACLAAQISALRLVLCQRRASKAIVAPPC